MITWTYDRTKITDPILQVGWSGLALSLFHGEKSELHPDIRQTDTLKWELEQTKITITFESPDDLNKLLNCQLGDFRQGVGIIPGYETNPSRPGFYTTARAHLGITGGMFSTMGKNLPRRSDSIKDLKKHEAQFGPMITKVDCLEIPGASEEAPGRRFEIHVRPHSRAIGPMNMKLTGKGKFSKRMKFGTVIHPGLATWNNVPIQGTPEEYFLAAYSALGYFWTISDVGKVGLGNTAETLDEVLSRVRMWTLQGTSILSVAGDAYTTAWAIAAALRLPEGSYPLFYGEKVVGVFDTTLGDYPISRIYELFDHMAEPVTPAQMTPVLKQLKGVPVRQLGDLKVSALDLLLRNLKSGRRWCVGMGAGVTLQRKKNTGWFAHERDALSTIATYMGDPMEQAVANRMSKLYQCLVKSFDHYKGGSKNHYDKAREFAVAIHLNRANTYGGLLGAITAIQNRVGSPPPWAKFSAEEFAWILDNAKKDLPVIKHLLILACGGVDFRTPEQRAESAQTPAPEPVALNYDQIDN